MDAGNNLSSHTTFASMARHMCHYVSSVPVSTLSRSIVKLNKAHQRLFFWRTRRKNNLSAAIRGHFYRCATESIIATWITVWYGNCSGADREALHRVVKSAQGITRTSLPAIGDVQEQRCLRRMRSILKDSPHGSSSHQELRDPGLYKLMFLFRVRIGYIFRPTEPREEEPGSKDPPASALKQLWEK